MQTSQCIECGQLFDHTVSWMRPRCPDCHRAFIYERHVDLLTPKESMQSDKQSVAEKFEEMMKYASVHPNPETEVIENILKELDKLSNRGRARVLAYVAHRIDGV